MQLLNTLYVNTPGSYLRLDNATLRVDVERETRLRVQSGVAQARSDDTGDDVGLAGRPLELHPLAAGFLQDPGTGFDGGSDAEMLVGKGKIDDHHRMGAGSDDDLAVVDHLFEGRRNGRIAPRHDHRHAVADEDAVDPGAVDEFGGRPVVGGDHRQATFVPFRSREIGEGNAAGGVRHGVRMKGGGGRSVMAGGCGGAV